MKTMNSKTKQLFAEVQKRGLYPKDVYIAGDDVNHNTKLISVRFVTNDEDEMQAIIYNKPNNEGDVLFYANYGVINLIEFILLRDLYYGIFD